jgi:signal recognition particle receptor subunit beta
LRAAWGPYAAKTNAIIFVVDAAWHAQLDHAANELKLLLEHEHFRELRDIPLLVFANKQDLEGAKSPAEISEALNLGELLGQRRWNIAPCSATDRVGIAEGMDWLVVSVFSESSSNFFFLES